MNRLIAFFLTAWLTFAATPPAFDEIAAVIRDNDLVKLRQLVQSKEAANVASGLGMTPLHYAAIYGSPEALQVLLAAGADPNSHNQVHATPLVYAAWSFDRAHLLVEAGAAANVVASDGITPLLVAAAAQGNLPTLKYLLSKGANLQAQSSSGSNALIRAAQFGDVAMTRFLLEQGADAKHADKGGFTALLGATGFPDRQRIQLLLAAGGDPNAFNSFGGMVKNGPIALVHLSPLMTAAPHSDQETIACLLKAGAHVNALDSRKMNSLMLAIATDFAQPATVRQLIAAGADVQAKDTYGASVLDWARRFGNPEILAMLQAAGAKAGDPVAQPATLSGDAPFHTSRQSVEKAMTVFSKSDFFQSGGGCAGCHHQVAYARAYAAAGSAGLSPDPALRRAFLDSVAATRPRMSAVAPFLSTFGGDFDVVLSLLSASADLKEPANSFTDLMVHFLAARQDISGGWIAGGIARPPIEDSDISRTAYAIQALTHYGWPARKAEFDQRIQSAKRWLETASPVTTYEHADRIFGLREAGVPVNDLRAAASRLLKLQRADGGWAQTSYLESDAYATGLILETLYRSGLLSENDPAYRRGAAYLMHNQYPDGSWLVRSRAPKFQPYFQSGFPFDHDQWISSMATAWAVMALSHSTSSAIASR
jgi:ankyrin repeat protein